MHKIFSVFWVVLLCTLAACHPGPSLTISINSTQTPTISLPVYPTVAVPATLTPMPLHVSNVMEVWIPERLDPRNNPAGEKIADSLLDFQKLHPEFEFKLRVKGESGETGIFNFLQAVQKAAPQSMPVLVLLKHDQLAQAQSLGLLFPYTSEAAFDEDWFDYGKTVSMIDGEQYGIPLMGDTLVLGVRNNSSENNLQTDQGFNALLEQKLPTVLPASSEMGRFALGLYLSAGGRINLQGRHVILEKEPLEEVLRSFEQGRRTGVFPGWSMGIQNNLQTWEAFQKESAQLLIAPYSSLSQKSQETICIEPLPGMDQGYYTLIDAWVWAITEPDEAQRSVAQELALSFGSQEFLNDWSPAAGYLAVRNSTLDKYPDYPFTMTQRKIILSAQNYPGITVQETLTTVLGNAVNDILGLQKGAVEAAETVLNQLSSNQ